MNTRLATIADAAAIAEIQISSRQVAYRGWLPDATLDALDVSKGADVWSGILAAAQHSVIIADSNSFSVGFCALRASRDNDAVSGTVADIPALYVRPGLWRRGVGRALCSHAFATAATAGYSWITLWTLVLNSRAINFYAALGFVPDGATTTERVTDDCIVDEIRMRRALQPPNHRDP